VTDVTDHARRVSAVAAALEKDELPPARWRLRPHVSDTPIDPFAPPKIEQVASAPAVAAPPIAPAAPPPPPPPPTAPPLPYTAIGDWTEAGHTVAFLSANDGLVMAEAGETLNGTYHVDQVSPGHITLTYLPLKQMQQLTWNSHP
jgi:hypothetical protein